MWKDFVAINGSERVRVLTCIAIDDPLGGGRRKELSALTPTPNRLYIGSGSKSTEGITYSEASLRYDRLWQLKVIRGDSLWQP